MASAYDDEIWAAVSVERDPPAQVVQNFVASLGSVGRALDLGCGDGLLALALDARELTLADVSPVALSRAAARLPDGEVVELDPDAPLPLADNRFDCVLCADTIEHVRDVSLLLSEIRRVLVPGGRLAITTPSHSRATALRILFHGFEPYFDPRSQHLRFLTGRSLSDLLGELGFEVESLDARDGALHACARR